MINRKKRKNKVKSTYFSPRKVRIYYHDWYWDYEDSLIYVRANARKMNTLNERRAWYDAKEQGVKVRGRRSPCNLPSNWDDITPSAWYEKKCWKRNSKRKHQWKYE